jgi:universal stress protein E
MSWRHIMFCVTSPGGVGPLEMGKVAQLASGLGAELELFHCIFDPDVTRRGRFGTHGAQEDIHEFVDRRREQLEHNAERLRASGVPVHTSVRWDYPIYEGIVRQVLRRKPSLLIAQSSSKGRAARLMLTQTDHKLIETCPCPVLFLKNGRPYSDAVIIAALDPGRSHNKPATLDDGILDTAGVIRDALSGTLRVFHAGAPWEYAVRMKPELRDLPEVVQEDVRGAYWNGVREQVLALARRHHVREECVEVLEGDAAELLPRVASRQSAHIVALGAVARTRVGRALIGHTAERVLDTLQCDVLIVKPPGFQTPVRRESTHHIERSAAHRGRYVL